MVSREDDLFDIDAHSLCSTLLKRECYSSTSGVLTWRVKNPSVTVTLGRCYGYTG